MENSIMCIEKNSKIIKEKGHKKLKKYLLNQIELSDINNIELNHYRKHGNNYLMWRNILKILSFIFDKSVVITKKEI